MTIQGFEPGEQTWIMVQGMMIVRIPPNHRILVLIACGKSHQETVHVISAQI